MISNHCSGKNLKIEEKKATTTVISTDNNKEILVLFKEEIWRLKYEYVDIDEKINAFHTTIADADRIYSGQGAVDDTTLRRNVGGVLIMCILIV